MRRFYAISASFLVFTGIFLGCTKQGAKDEVDKSNPKPIVKIEPTGKPKDKEKDPTPVQPVKNDGDDKQEQYQAALGDAIRALANRQWDDAMIAFQSAQAIDDTEFVRSEIARLKQQMDQDATAKETVKNIETVLSDGKAEEADKLAGEALKLFGGGDEANKLVLLRLQAIALMGVQTKEPDDAKFARYRDEAEAALDKKENNLRAAVLAMELALQVKDDDALKAKYDEKRVDLDKYDALRKKAAELRRDPQQLEDALTALEDAAKLWDTPQIRAEIDECQLAAKKRRDTVSVVNFDVRNDVGMPDAGAALADELLPKLKPRFDLVERTHVAKIIEELKLEASFGDDPKQQEQVGKLAKVRYLVLGSVSRKVGVTVRARLVDVRTGLVVQTAKLEVRDMTAALMQMPALAKQLMSDEFDAPPLPGAEIAEAAPDKGELLPPPREDDPAPKVNVNAQPPAFGKNFDGKAFAVLAPPPADFKPQQVEIWQGKQRNRLLFAAVELGDFLFRAGRFGDAQRQFEFALQLDPDNVQIQLRLQNVRPQVVVVVQQPGYVVRPKLAVMPFLVQGNPRLVPPSLSYWTPAALAPYFSTRYDVVDPTEIYWYMGRAGISMQDLLNDPHARRWLGRAVGVRYFVFGSCIETTSFDVNTYLLDVESGYLQGSATINVRDRHELRFRLSELATVTMMTPQERAAYWARLQQQRYVDLVAAGRKHMDQGRYREARDAFEAALQINPDNILVRNWFFFCQDRVRALEFDLARRQRLEAQQAAVNAARLRQLQLAKQSDEARRRAIAEAAARTPAQKTVHVNFRFQARDNMITQAQVALKTNRVGISVNLFQGAMDVAAPVGPSAPPPPPVDQKVYQNFAQARLQADRNAKLREAQVEAAREKALREAREEQFAKAQKDLENQRAADKARLEAVRAAQLNRDKQAYDAGVAQGQKLMQAMNYPAALAAFQGAQRVAHGPAQNETINAFINTIVERQALAAGRTQKALDAERAARKAAEAKAKRNEEMYQAALQAAQQALTQKKLEIAQAKFEEARQLFKTDAVESGLAKVKAARAAELAAAQKADEELMRAARVKTLLAEGRAWINDKKYENAVKSFQQAKKLAPDNLDVLAGLAQAQAGVQRPKVDPVVPAKSKLQDLIVAGQAALKAKNFDAAEKALKSARLLDPTNATVVQGLKDVAQGRKALAAAQLQEDYKAAFGAGQKALLGKNYDAAVQSFQQALKLVPNDPNALKALQQAQNALAQEAGAANFQKVMNAGQKALQTKNYEAAIQSFQQALKLVPNDPGAQKALQQAQKAFAQEAAAANLQKVISAGQKALQAKNYDVAIKSFQQALKLSPNEPSTLKLLQQAQNALAQEAAAANFQKAMNVGQKALQTKNYETAIQSFQQALKLSPNEPSALKLLQQAQNALAQEAAAANFQKVISAGQKALQAKNYDVAIKSFQQALKLVPNEPSALKLLQQAQNAQAQEAKTAASFQKAMDAGAKAMMLKKYADAVKAYTEAKNLNPDDARAKKLLTQAQQALTDANREALILANYDKAMTAGKNAMTAKNYKVAVSSYTNALKWIPNDKAATSQLKLAQQALQDSTKMKTPPPSDPNKQFTDALQRGAAAAKDKKYADAVKAYQEAAQLRPKDQDAQAGLRQNQFSLNLERGQQYLGNAMWKNAQSEFESALRLFPNNDQAKKLLQKAKSKMK